jgi:hypothetical protein
VEKGWQDKRPCIKSVADCNHEVIASLSPAAAHMLPVTDTPKCYTKQMGEPPAQACEVAAFGHCLQLRSLHGTCTVEVGEWRKMRKTRVLMLRRVTITPVDPWL